MSWACSYSTSSMSMPSPLNSEAARRKKKPTKDKPSKECPMVPNSHETKEAAFPLVSTDTSARPRTRTLDDRFNDASPASALLRNRHRFGSSRSIGSGSVLEDNYPLPSNSSSACHSPSVSMQSSVIEKEEGSLGEVQLAARPRTSRPPSRTASPATTRPSRDLSAHRLVAVPDSTKILNLMKSKNGAMRGYLRFAVGRGGVWTSGYCLIDQGKGTLVCEPAEADGTPRTLVPDLRACQVNVIVPHDSHSSCIHILTHNRCTRVQIRPLITEDLDIWLAAFLCWKPLRPRGAKNKISTPQEASLSERRVSEKRRNSDASGYKESSAIVKVGKMQYLEPEKGSIRPSSENASPTKYRPRKEPGLFWRKASCILQENGELKIYAEQDIALLATVNLSQLSRCAVQPLDVSVLQEDYCIAIYPHYCPKSTKPAPSKPIHLAVDSRVLYEVWLVLLRAFTLGDLYGPKDVTRSLQDTTVSPPSNEALDASKMGRFRTEHSLYVRITEAKMQGSRPRTTPESSSVSLPRFHHDRDTLVGDYFCEVHLDGEVRARTAMKCNTTNPFWFEHFTLTDLPAVLSTFQVLLRRRRAKSSSSRRKLAGLDGPRGSQSAGFPFDEPVSLPQDDVFGRIEPPLDFTAGIDGRQELEGWWPIMDSDDQCIGEALLHIRAEQQVVLMGIDYQPLSDLLHHLTSGLTISIAHALSTDLRRLSETLLDIFQASGQATEWLMMLIEDEIDGSQKNSRTKQKFNLGRRMGSADSYDSASEREVVLRGLGKSATVESSLLFRGNTILTKSLDLHMRRLGKEYLFDTLASILTEIEERDLDCEVDPNRVASADDLEGNWRNLVTVTELVWEAIYNSVSRCPTELRFLLRHVRACAEDRYGDFLRTVSYSSVSAFLFLRFFCPAVLNPKLFGLLKNHPASRVQRTFTLIAKTLQGLANMTTFGIKEDWMIAMNSFLAEHRLEFKTFVDTIVDVSAERRVSLHPPSYATPKSLLGRLPPLAREGLPSLPYLIDQPRAFATLVNLWLDAPVSTTQELEGELVPFHFLCVGLRQRTDECLLNAEEAGRPSAVLLPQWEEVVAQLEHPSPLESLAGTDAPSLPSTRPPSIRDEEVMTSIGRPMVDYESDDLSRKSRSDTWRPSMSSMGAAREGAKGKLSHFVGGLRWKSK